jgi:RNA polymerase sigma factor (sigma-70 family)
VQVHHDRGRTAKDGAQIPKKYATYNDEALLSALKAEESGAFSEIVRRYQGLIFRYARHLGVAPEEQREWVIDLLHDVVLSVIKPGAIIPSSLGSYFARACRNKAYMEHRARTRREVREKAASTIGQSGSVVESLCSEETLRNSRGADCEESDNFSAAVQRFANELEQTLTNDEREMLDWTSESVPLRLIAEWRGVSRDVVAHRVSRLKSRLRKATPGILERFSATDRAEVERFLGGDSGND